MAKKSLINSCYFFESFVLPFVNIIDIIYVSLINLLCFISIFYMLLLVYLLYFLINNYFYFPS